MMASTGSSKTEPKAFIKRDFLRSIETACQKRWDAEKLFEVDAPPNAVGKEDTFFVTFPYPYMNGRLHLGHAFSATKCEFAVGYQRLRGKTCLFPFGFHCTGMPIKACADKLKREIELYGNPPIFPLEESTEAQAKQKSKVAAKTGGKTYQWQIMQSIGLSDEEIPLFSDPMYWLEYFPPLAKSDCQKLGLKVDWRRSMITTDANPYYDQFIRWQFTTLNDLGKVKFGNRHTIYSPIDKQPCMDHDRQSGEGVGPQEYCLVKMRALDPLPAKLEKYSDKSIFFVCATLRPETMYGQTNCWIRPDMKYGLFVIDENTLFVCTERCARNCSYQNLSREFGVVEKICDFLGQDLLGTALKSPLCKYERIYALPMLSIKDDKGSGVVSSVPSDSPDDWAAFRDLKNKPAFREKYLITDDMVLPFEVVPILSIPEYGDCAALHVCDLLKIKSQNDRDNLEKAKEMVYMKGFYEGVLLLGDYQGKKVKEVKHLIKQQMIDSGDIILYFEPEKKVISRSGDECVVALCDQWFLNYGEPIWQKETMDHLSTMELFSPEIRNQFEGALNWLNQWACSRSFGLGTRLPWDEQWLIESLSDSTIYMAFYTICHILQEGVFDGSQGNRFHVQPQDLTKPVFDYIFLNAKVPKSSSIPLNVLNMLKNEFNYWYPLNLRCSGKDLVPNHLSFSLYTHCAIFPPEMRPKAMRANGFLMLNGEKLSKSTGNFKTLVEGVEDYTADGVRMALADAGDGLDDANFVEDTANMAVLRLYTQIEWISEMLKDNTLREGEPETFNDLVFESEINKTILACTEYYEKMLYREALKCGFFEFQAARDRYRESTSFAGGMNKKLILRFIEIQALILSPICPHFGEHIWGLLGYPTSILTATWPIAAEPDLALLKASSYLNNLTHDLRLKMKPATKRKGPPSAPPTKVTLFVASKYPAWQEAVLRVLKDSYDNTTQSFPSNNEILAILKEIDVVKPQLKKVMPYVQFVRNEVSARGPTALESTVPFDEMKIVEDNKEFLTRALELMSLQVLPSEEGDEKVQELCSPMKPLPIFS